MNAGKVQIEADFFVVNGDVPIIISLFEYVKTQYIVSKCHFYKMLLQR